MVISTNLGFLGSYYQKKKKNIEEKIYCSEDCLVWSSGIQLIPYSLYKICIPKHCSWSENAPMSPKRILEFDQVYGIFQNRF